MYKQKYISFWPIDLILIFIFNGQYLTHHMIEQCYFLCMNDESIDLNLVCFEASICFGSLHTNKRVFHNCARSHMHCFSAKQVKRKMWLFNISPRLDISRMRMSSYSLELSVVFWLILLGTFLEIEVQKCSLLTIQVLFSSDQEHLGFTITTGET